jgi:hypothetical protein
MIDLSQIPPPQQYDPPVSKLLTVGDVRNYLNWPDYPAAYGLTLDHAPDLLRMVQDDGLNWADSDSDEVWAPVHAWRALGQLGAETVVADFVATFKAIDDEESGWRQDEYPVVMALIGPAAIPALQAYMADEKNGLWSRSAAGTALVKIAEAHPQSRADCVAILSDQLSRHEKQDPSFNAFLVGNLTDLRAVAAAPVMEAAFAAGSVDLSVMGDWEEVQIELGLLRERLTPEPEYGWIPEEAIPLAKSLRESPLAQIFANAHAEPQPPPRIRAQSSGKKVGRNEPCPCGSGLKYKKCHGKPGAR